MTCINNKQTLIIDGLSKSFGSTRVVDGLDLKLSAGRVAGLVGPNGSGKSTILRIVVGLLAPDDGVVTVVGAPAGSVTARAAIGYVPDEPSGLDELSVDELVDLIAALYGSPSGYKDRADALLAAFALDMRVASRLGSLSHGLRRSAAMTVAFALAPALLVIDEATAALDPEAVVVLREALRALAAGGSAVLLATQDLTFAEAVCDEVSLLSRGRLLAHGSPEELRANFASETLEEVFLNVVGCPSRLEELSGVFGSR